MKDTQELRQKLIQVSEKFERGEISATEARVMIGAARGILDTLKVEIAAAHLNMGHVPPVALGRAKPAPVMGKKVAA